MSRHLLGLPYVELKTLLYPHPPYKSFVIQKRNGTSRLINEPRRKLKDLQAILLAYLYEHASSMKPCVHGFTPGRSIVTNANAHCSPKTRFLLNIDIEDFFPSITFYRVRGILQSKPFAFSYSVATVLAQLCTFNGVLPQGAPTSPLLANLACRSLDGELMNLARRHRATYSRYADDITFSFSVTRSESLPANVCSFDSGILTLGEELRAIFASHSFRINPNKSRLSSRRHRLEVTGVTINKFPNVKRKFVDTIRGGLHAWKVYGYSLAQAEWEKRVVDGMGKDYEHRPWKRQTRIRVVPKLKNVLWGKLLYLRMVRGSDDALYMRLAKRYNALCKGELSKGTFVCSSLPVDSVVRTRAGSEDAVFVIEWIGDYKISGLGITEMVGGQGTAFAYKDVGLITCNHVLGFSGELVDDHARKNEFVHTAIDSKDVNNAKLTITNPMTGNSWKGKIVCRDKDYDLAIIQFDDENPPSHHYFQGRGTSIQVPEKGTLIGFPNHSPGKRADYLEEHHVLNRYIRSGLDRFDITGSGSIRKGSSGGPFVDESYRVAGVAQEGAKHEAGNDQCLCVTELDKWLSGLEEASPLPSTALSAGVVLPSDE